MRTNRSLRDRVSQRLPDPFLVAQLVNLGSLCIDNVYRVGAITRAGETAAASSHARFMGGKGLNQSLAAARAGVATAHVGCVGADGEELVAVLDAAGVDVSAIRRTPNAPSGHAVIQVDASGRNAIVIVGGANRLIETADVDVALDLVEPGGWLLLQNEINDVPAVLASAAARGARVVLNVAPVDGREAGYDLSSVAILIVNDIEAAALSGEREPEGALAALTARHPSQHVVLTRGELGLLYGRGAERMSLQAFEVAAVDATGAGDAFIGYFLSRLIAGASMKDALTTGSAAGALAVTVAGAATSIPCAADVRAFLERHAAG